MLENRIHISTKLFIYFYMLHNLRFFQFEPYVKLGSILTFIDIAFAIYFLIIFMRHGINMKKTPAWKSITIFYVIFLFSIFNAYFQSGQALYYGLRGIAYTYMNIGFFYYLSYKRVPMKFLIKLCWFMLISYITALLISYIQYPNNIFGYRASLDSAEMLESLEKGFESRGVYRFSFLGGDYIALMLFFVIMQRKRFKHSTILILALLVMTLLRGTRGPITATLVLSILAYIISNKSKLKNIIYVSLICLSVYILAINIPFTSKIINSITETTENEIDAYGNENVRLLSFAYFTIEFNEGRTLPMIIGNGVPTKGRYFDKVAAANNIGLYENDIEYIQWYLFFGFVGLVALLYWGITFLRLKIPKEYTFIKIFIAYIFITMTLGSHFFRGLPTIAMLCYILYYLNITATYTQKNISARQQ